MITQWHSGETIIDRLRVKGARIDPALAQLRLSSLLNNALSHPTTLPPSAIVFVRKLSDPLPRSLPIQHNHIRPPSAWQQALNSTLESLVANAARPALGLVPANAQAVVFLDRSELLAALATDWCEGQVSSRWWWQSLPRRTTVSQLVKEFWQSAPEYVPAAIDKLETVGRAATFVEAFSDSESRALLLAVARSFALNDLVSVAGELPVAHKLSTSNSQVLAGSLVSSKKSDAEDVGPTAVPAKAPWDDWIQTTKTSDPGPEQQRLLGVALMLQRAPAKVRAKSFAQAVDAWSRNIIQVATKPVAASQQKKKKEARVSPIRTVSESSTAGSENASSTQLKFHVSSSEELSPEEPAKPSLLSKLVSTEMDIAPRDIREVTVGCSESEPAETEEPNSSSHPQLLPIADPNVVTSRAEYHDTNNNLASPLTTTEPAPAALEESAVIDLHTETEFGGLFYLINLGIYLGFYGDFTTPAEPGIDLNIWDFVALVGRELEGKRIEADPLWPVLIDLSGRHKGDDPGDGFNPPNAWRVPPEWLKPFSEGVADWWTTGRRLLLRHPAGFLMLDVARTRADPAKQLQRELSAYDHFKSSISLLSSGRRQRSQTDATRHSIEMRPQLRHWLDLLMPYVRVRLRRALGLNEEQDPASMLCEQRARISVAAAHLDVFMELADLPVEIRLAGLDRNPGWVPAAGRFITFHFE